MSKKNSCKKYQPQVGVEFEIKNITTNTGDVIKSKRAVISETVIIIVLLMLAYKFLWR